MAHIAYKNPSPLDTPKKHINKRPLSLFKVHTLSFVYLSSPSFRKYIWTVYWFELQSVYIGKPSLHLTFVCDADDDSQSLLRVRRSVYISRLQQLFTLIVYFSRLRKPSRLVVYASCLYWLSTPTVYADQLFHPSMLIVSSRLRWSSTTTCIHLWASHIFLLS